MSAELVAQQLRMCQMIVKRNVGEITHEESLVQPGKDANSLNWVLGHVVKVRSGILGALGGEPVWGGSEGSRYDRHAPPNMKASEAKPLAEIWKAYDLTQERLLAALESLPASRLSEALPAGAPAKTVGELVAVLGMHDAYHTGQTGTLRRLLGKPAVDL